MVVQQIEDLAGQMASQLLAQFLRGDGQSYALNYDGEGNLEGDFKDVFVHHGIYAFRLCKGRKVAVAYVGKSEGDDRLRQHLTGNNKNGSRLAPSVGHKHESIKQAIQDGFTVHVCLYSNLYFGKPSLACVELASIQAAQAHLKKTFPTVKPWNEKLG